MGLFNNFPYLDLSNLNLDFILKETRHLKDYKEIAEASAATAEEAKNTAVQASESAAEDAETASTSAESAQNYAEHIADPVGGLVTTWLDDNITPTTPPVDASLTIQGAAADAKATGDAIDDLSALVAQGMPYEVKIALNRVLQNVAFENNSGYDSDLTVINNWASSIEMLSIDAVFNQGANAVYSTDSLDVLRQYLTVTANYDNGTSLTVDSYALSGDLTVGTSTITVSYGGKTTTFTVVVSAPTREMIFGAFTNGYTTIKANSSTYYPDLGKHCYRQATPARACTQSPFANANRYVLTVTDSSKYNILIDDITDDTPVDVPRITQAVDGVAYHAGDKSVGWLSSDSVTTSWGWIALKKMDGTAFTDEELADGAAAVFTYTEV